jgi:hypothetical protein
MADRQPGRLKKFGKSFSRPSPMTPAASLVATICSYLNALSVRTRTFEFIGFVAVRSRAVDAVCRIDGECIVLTEIVEERRQRRQLTANIGGRQLARLQMRAPGNDVGARHAAQLRRFLKPGEGGEFRHVDFVSTAGFKIGDISEPFDFWRNVGE